MPLRLLILWAGWRLLRRLVGTALVTGAILLTIYAIHFPPLGNTTAPVSYNSCRTARGHSSMRPGAR